MWSGCLGISGFFLMLPLILVRTCWGGAGPCSAHSSSTPEGSQNHAQENPVPSCLLQLPEVEVRPKRREGLFGYREPGQKWRCLHCTC